MRKRVTLLMAIILMVVMAVFAVACFDSGDNPSGSAGASESTSIDSGVSDSESVDESESISETVSECEHSGGTATCMQRAVCVKCGKEYGDYAAHVYGDWQHDEEKHWKGCITEGCTSKSEEGEHAGGEANCKDKAICSACGEGYGKLNAENHASTETKFVSNGNGTHNKVHSCCETIIDENIACSGGEATECGKKNVCEACGGEYGEPLSHAWATEWSFDETNHWHACTRVGCTAKTDESAHTGGEATKCEEKNICEVCGGEYGEPLPHAWATEWSSDEAIHWHACTREGCTKKSDEGLHTGGTPTCIAKAVCEICNNEYGDFADHTYGEWQHDNEKHWKECTTEGCTAKSEEGSHNFSLWDKSAADYDYKACECGMVDESQSFDKTVSLINQKISLSQSAYSVVLGGVSDYVSVEKIVLENYEFGTNLETLEIGDDFKADTKMHGKQTLTVTVKGEDEATHEIKVPVTFITAEITDSVEFAELQPKADNKAVYGYYVLNNDISGVSTGVAYSDLDWDDTTGFFGTLDGQGYTITAPSNENQGLFGILRSATIKNLTIKDNWRSGGDATLLARGCFGITMENVNIVYGGGPAMTGCGWLSNAEFSNNKLINVTIDNGSTSFTSVFGNKFRNNAFDNVVIKGTFTELGFTGVKDKEGSVTVKGESVTTAGDVAKIEIKRVTLDGRQDFILDGGVSVIDLGEYNGSEIISATTSTGFDLTSLSSEYVDDAFKATKEKHGEQNVNVTLIYKGETVVVVVPVTVITKYIKTMSELQDAVKHTGSNLYGYYILANDVSVNEEGYVAKNATYAWNSGTGFKGTLDGRGKTITMQGDKSWHGLFGTLNGATVKNLTINNARYNGWAASVFGYTAYNTTFENIKINVSGNTVNKPTDNTKIGVIVGMETGGCSWKDITINVANAQYTLFHTLNKDGKTDKFENVKVIIPGLTQFSDNGQPDGVTVGKA